MSVLAPKLRLDASDLDSLCAVARFDFGIFVELAFPDLHGGQSLIHAPYIDVIVAILVGSTDDGENRFIINLPPGYLKSMLVSVLWVAWRLGVEPSSRIICVCHGDELAHNLSIKTRSLMQSALYRKIFPDTIPEKKAQDNITTTKGGGRYATAVGGPIAGFRADIIVIDDVAPCV